MSERLQAGDPIGVVRRQVHGRNYLHFGAETTCEIRIPPSDWEWLERYNDGSKTVREKRLVPLDKMLSSYDHLWSEAAAFARAKALENEMRGDEYGPRVLVIEGDYVFLWIPSDDISDDSNRRWEIVCRNGYNRLEIEEAVKSEFVSTKHIFLSCEFDRLTEIDPVSRQNLGAALRQRCSSPPQRGFICGGRGG